MIKVIRLFFDEQVVGSILVFAGSITFITFAMTGLYLDMIVVEGLAGFWGSVIAFTLFPLTLVLVPWYVLLAYGSLVHIAICYGGVMGGALVLAVGMLLKARACEVMMPLSASKYRCASSRVGRKSLEGSV